MLAGTLLAALAIASCGAGGNGYGCTGDQCTAMYDGAGSLRVTLKRIENQNVTLSVTRAR